MMRIFGTIPAIVSSLILCASGWCALDAGGFDYGAFLKTVQVPPGFTIELAAGEPAIRFPMFA